MRIQEAQNEVMWQSVPGPAVSRPCPDPQPVAVAPEYARNHVLVHYLHCCGIKELKGISAVTPKQAVQDFCFQRTAPELIAPTYNGPNQSAARDMLSRQQFGCAFVLFTYAGLGSVIPNSYGEELKAFIIEQGLGTVTVAGAERNPNSGNIVTAYLWNVNHTALFKWWKENPYTTKERETLLQNYKIWKESHLL